MPDTRILPPVILSHATPPSVSVTARTIEERIAHTETRQKTWGHGTTNARVRNDQGVTNVSKSVVMPQLISPD
jgi:hypothetical protein